MGRKNKCAKKLNQRSKKLARDSAKTNKSNKTNVINKQAATEATNTVVEINTANQDKAVETNTQNQDIRDEVTEDL